MTDVTPTLTDGPPIVSSNSEAVVKPPKSEYPFVWDDLDGAIKIVEVAQRCGGETDNASIAQRLGANPNNGAFRSKIGAARLYGFIGPKKGTITVTELGASALRPETRGSAYVTAFLNVPLFARLYDLYKVGTLPSPEDLEARMRTLGVPASSVRIARYQFQRAAKQAGFFSAGSERLVKPSVHELTAESSNKLAGDVGPEDTGDGLTQEIGMKHEMIVSLFRDLPDKDAQWDANNRQAWEKMLKATLDYLYPAPSLDPNGAGSRDDRAITEPLSDHASPAEP